MSQTIDRVAVITGGSLGIGEAISTQMLGLGWEVHILARRASGYVHADHDGCRTHDVDVRDLVAVKETADAIASTSGRVDALVLCAGVGYPTPLHSVSRAQYDELFDTNVAGSVFSTQAFTPCSVTVTRSSRSSRPSRAAGDSPTGPCTAPPSTRWRGSPRVCATNSGHAASG